MGLSSITIPERRIPVFCEADVVIAGAGAAGIAAAVAAARSGAKVVLLEHYNSPGGMTTSGLLPSIIHMTDGPNMLSGGICKEVVDELVRRSGRPLNYNWQNIDHEVLKRVFDDLLEAAGVTVLYQTHIYDCIVADGVLQAVAASAPGGNIAITGKIFIDFGSSIFLLCRFSGAEAALSQQEDQAGFFTGPEAQALHQASAVVPALLEAAFAAACLDRFGVPFPAVMADKRIAQAVKPVRFEV